MTDAKTTAKRKRDESDVSDNISKLIRLSDTDIIYVKVGQENPKTYVVHRDIICKQSLFFRTESLKHDSKGEVQTIKLSELAPELFGEYLHWLYTNTSKLDAIANDAAINPGPERDVLVYVRVLVDLWYIGCTVKDVEFMSLAFQQI